MNTGTRDDALPSGAPESDPAAAQREFQHFMGCGLTPVFVTDPMEYLRGVRTVLLAGSAIAAPILWLMTA